MFSKELETAIYIHWPFCAAKCPYCDFNSHVAETIDHDEWLSVYLREIDRYAGELGRRRVVSIYFGGGTPSLMKPATVAGIIDAIQGRFAMANDVEITLEANPTSVEAGKLAAFRSAGVNRVSMGVQALNDADLKFLGRQHSVVEGLKAIEIAQAHFERMNFDLIYARPEQSLNEWRQELERAVKLSSGHLSVYQLTIERNTPFYKSHQRGDFKIPEQELAADFYLLTGEILEAAGMPAYEISNHARAGQESRHNLMYWQYGDYIGIGPGAHGRITSGGQKFATRAMAAPDRWLAEQYEVREEILPRDQLYEALLMGLRLREGLERARFSDILHEENLDKAITEGWLVTQDDGLRIRATLEGWLRLNALIDFVSV